MLGGEAALRPGAWQAAMQRHGVEHLNLDGAFYHQAFDDVKAVEFRRACGQERQVPAAWRRGTAGALPAIQQAASGEHTADGAHTWHGRLQFIVRGGELRMNGQSAPLPKSRGAEGFARLQNGVLLKSGGAVGSFPGTA